MAFASGAQVRMLGKAEQTFKTFPTGDFQLLPFVSCNLGLEQQMIEDNSISGTRDRSPPIYGLFQGQGDIVVPLDTRNIGFWLKHTMGAPATTGTGPYVHTYQSAAMAIPSMGIEIGHPDLAVPIYLQHSGIILDSMEVTFEPGSQANNVTFRCYQVDEVKALTSGGGTPTEAEFTRFNSFQGSISQGGSPLGAVTNARMTYANNLDAFAVVGSGGKYGGIVPQEASLTGSIAVRFENDALYDIASGTTPTTLELKYEIDANNSVVFTAPQVYLPKPKLPIRGPGGIEATYDFQASRKSDGTKMLTVALTNDVATY